MVVSDSLGVSPDSCEADELGAMPAAVGPLEFRSIDRDAA